MERRWLATAAAPVLLVASVLLIGSLAHNLARLDTGAELLPPSPETRLGIGTEGPGNATGAGALLRGFFLTLMWVLLGGGIAAAVYAKARGAKLLKLVTVWELLGYALALVAFLAIVTYWQDLSAMVRGTGQEPLIPSDGGSANQHGATESDDPATGAIVLAIAILVFLAAGMAVPLMRFLRAMTRKGPTPQPSTRALAAQAVGRAVRVLQEGGDYRKAVIRCYSELIAVLAAKGIRGQEHLTAREIEGLALEKVGLSRGSVDALTAVFEEARYSTHDIGPGQRDAAVGALESIKRELEGPARASA